MNKIYVLSFNNETGRLFSFASFDNLTKEQQQTLRESGFELVTKEVFELVTGVTDGKEYMKNPNGDGFVVYVPPIEQTKRHKINEFKNKRDYEEVQPIEVNNHLFDYDGKARDRISAAIVALEGQDPIYWTTADNSNVLVSANDLKNVVRAVAVRSNALHVKYRQLKEQVLNATTNEQVEAITWEEQEE